MDIETKNITKDKEGHFMMTQGSTKQEDITVTDAYVPNYQASKYIRQKLIDLKNRKFHKHICFSSACATFTKIDQMFGLFKECHGNKKKKEVGKMFQNIRDIISKCNLNLDGIWFRRESYNKHSQDN